MCEGSGFAALRTENIRFNEYGLWFKRLKDGDYDLKETATSGRPSLEVEEELERESKSSVREVASSFGLRRDTVCRCQTLSKWKGFKVWATRTPRFD
uniref:Uncharacterized protein n=1 Tax=Caenorhabditis japonica TaxID=281687 RepID=A0A8R1E4U8_CAEJA